MWACNTKQQLVCFNCGCSRSENSQLQQVERARGGCCKASAKRARCTEDGQCEAARVEVLVAESHPPHSKHGDTIPSAIGSPPLDNNLPENLSTEASPKLIRRLRTASPSNNEPRHRAVLESVSCSWATVAARAGRSFATGPLEHCWCSRQEAGVGGVFFNETVLTAFRTRCILVRIRSHCWQIVCHRTQGETWEEPHQSASTGATVTNLFQS
jgi:hypothetical protein